MKTHRASLGTLGLLILAAVLAHPNLGAAQGPAAGDDATRAAARQLGEQGLEAYFVEDFRGAEEKLDRAYQLFATPTLGLWSGRARVRLGRLVEAAERFRDAARLAGAIVDSVAQQQAQQDATKELAELSPRIPSLTLQVEGADPAQVAISIDGATVPSALIGVARPTNPGKHLLVAARGTERLEVELTLHEKDKQVAPFRFNAATAALSPPPAPGAPAAKSQRQLTAATPDSRNAGRSARSVLVPVAIGAFALGGASLVAAAIVYGVAAGKCPGGDCVHASDEGPYGSLRTVTMVTSYGGGALVLAGALTWLLAPSDEQQPAAPALSWAVEPTGVSVRGVF